jgi:hypothetical protein
MSVMQRQVLVGAKIDYRLLVIELVVENLQHANASIK